MNSTNQEQLNISKLEQTIRGLNNKLGTMTQDYF